MLYGAKGGRVQINSGDMDYISFGMGAEVLVMIPGLTDGIRTVRGVSLPMAISYRKYAKKYRVYMFSRNNVLARNMSTRDMARELKMALDELGIVQADVLGVSQGGMIAQYLAIDYPELVQRLVLASTVSRQNEVLQGTVRGWIRLAEQGDYPGLMADIAEKSYSDRYLEKNHLRFFYPLLGKIGKPKNFERFLIQANACISHNAYDELNKIQCPTLVIGGGSDKIVGSHASAETAEKIFGSRLVVYEDLGHLLFSETKAFDSDVLGFLT